MNRVKLNGSRILVTGGAGFIGSNFLREIANFDCGIAVIDKLTYAGKIENIIELIDGSRIDFVQGDICDEALLKRQFKDIDIIVNFAAESHVDNSIVNDKEFIRTNIQGTQSLLNFALGAGVKTFIQISTDEVYGSINVGSWDEYSPIMPNSPYSASKASADLLAFSYKKTHNLDVRITRCSNNYGPRQHSEKFIPKVIISALKDLPIPIYGKGDNFREWISVKDHCNGIIKVIEKGEPGEVYNIGSGVEIKNIDLAHKILDMLGKKDALIDFVRDRKGHDFRYSVNSEKIKKLGFTISRTFDAELLKTIEWYKQRVSL